MTLCPVDGKRMWSLDDEYLTCHDGHRMAKHAIQPAGAKTREVVIIQPRAHWPWWRSHAEIPWAIAGVLLLAQIVEVVL